jgi:hypothetical protein
MNPSPYQLRFENPTLLCANLLITSSGLKSPSSQEALRLGWIVTPTLSEMRCDSWTATRTRVWPGNDLFSIHAGHKPAPIRLRMKLRQVAHMPTKKESRHRSKGLPRRARHSVQNPDWLQRLCIAVSSVQLQTQLLIGASKLPGGGHVPEREAVRCGIRSGEVDVPGQRGSPQSLRLASSTGQGISLKQTGRHDGIDYRLHLTCELHATRTRVRGFTARTDVGLHESAALATHGDSR